MIFNRSDTVSYDGKISGNGNLTKTGGGTLTLTNTNSYLGTTTVTGGTLGIGGDGNIGNGTRTLVGGILQLTGATYEKGWTLGTGTNAIGTSGSANMKGVLSGTGSLTKTDGGTLTLSGANIYTGDTTITGGTLEVTGTLGGGNYARNIVNWDTLVFNQSANQTLSGVISESGGSKGLTKNGTGTLTLSGVNTYTGDTIINEGTLELAASGSLLSPVMVANNPAGATFALRGSVTGNVNLAGNNSALNAYQGGSITGDLTTNGGALNFYLPPAISTSSLPLVEVQNATLTGSPVNLYLDGGNDLSALSETESIKLLHAGGTLTADSSYSDLTLKSGVSLIDTSRVFSIAATSQDLTATLKSTYVPPPPPPPPPSSTRPPSSATRSTQQATARGCKASACSTTST
ncbi:hypothetical protein AGMMS50256_38920 [Betaproteobacteria bacterium]|nr:hypothetical protein AGMMS50256_38920 [Betaproteobacteria bacterium]